MINEDEEDRIATIFGLAHIEMIGQGRIPADLYYELSIIGRHIGIDLIDTLKNHPGTIEGLMEKFGIKVIVEAKTPVEMEAIKAQAHKEGFIAKMMSIKLDEPDNRGDVGGIDATGLKLRQTGRGIKLDYDKPLSHIMLQNFSGFRFEIVALTRNNNK